MDLGSYDLLPAHFSIIGVARRPLSDDIFRDKLGKDVAELGTQPVDPNLWGKFRERFIDPSSSRYKSGSSLIILGLVIRSDGKRLGFNRAGLPSFWRGFYTVFLGDQKSGGFRYLKSATTKRPLKF